MSEILYGISTVTGNPEPIKTTNGVLQVSGSTLSGMTTNKLQKALSATTIGDSAASDTGSALTYTPASTSASTVIVNDGTNPILTVATDNAGPATAPRVIVGGSVASSYSLVINNSSDTAAVHFQNGGTSRYQIKSNGGYLNFLEMGTFSGFSFGVNGATHGVGVGTGIGADNWRVLKTGVVSIGNGVNTAGLGNAFIYASYSTTGNTAAVTNAINYTPPAAAGRYRLSWSITPTTSTTHNFTVVGTWKNASGAAVSQNLGGFDKNGTGLVAGAITNTIGAGVYYGDVLFDIDNSQTAITISTAGTFTTVTYNFSATLEQLA